MLCLVYFSCVYVCCLVHSSCIYSILCLSIYFTVVFFLFLFLFLYIQFIMLRCISMLHVRLDVWIRSVPFRVQLLSYSCWDSGCSHFRPWFGVRLGGILSTTTFGRAIIGIIVCFHLLTACLYH